MVAVLFVLASYIQHMLLNMAKEEVHILLGVTREIDKMGTKLGDLKNFLANADRRNITDLSVKAWVRELRDAMYDATNILDLCQLKAMEQGPRHDVGCFNPLLLCIRNPIYAHDIGSRIKNLNRKLDDIKARGASFNFINLGNYDDRGRNVVSYGSSTRETSGSLVESGLVGEKIEEDTTYLVEMLTKKYPTNDKVSSKITVFSIVGLGGIGKTTLAQKIFNNEVIKVEFKKQIWLSVNQGFDEIEMLKRVIIQAGGNHQDCGNSKVSLEQALIEALKGQKTLLIMDDVWDSRIWEGVLRTPFMNAMLAEGSCVLVTTRHDTVARELKAEEPYHHIDKLGLEDAWLLLKKQVVGRVNDEHHLERLKDIGMGIIEKCDGLPLAVKVIGGLLRQKNLRRADWETVLKDSLWSVSQMPKDLSNSIYLSYDDLSPGLKHCFLHYSLLPKGTIFLLDDIVGMWISEGFIHGTSRELEEIGKEYYEELIQRNLIEPNKRYIDRVVCNMHDVIRSFAQYVAGDESLVEGQNSEFGIMENRLNSQKLIRLSLENKGSEPEWCSLQAHKSLRTLISVGHVKINPGDSLCSFSSLRTLHLESINNLDLLVESLYQLKHLRYLSIENSDASSLPENIGKLKFLQYISLFRCQSLVKLPSSIAMLQHLRFLKLSRTSIKSIPEGFSGLTTLRKLHGFPIHMDGDRCSLQDLGPLCQLTELGMRLMENASSSSFASEVKLTAKTCLRELTLNCTSRLGVDGSLDKDKEGYSEKEQLQIEEVFNELCPPSSLENLYMHGYFGERLPRWMMLTESMPLESLRFLTMDDLACCTELPDGLCQLPWLEILQIDRAPAIRRLGQEFVGCKRGWVGAGFSRLVKLNLIGMVEWEEWEWEEQVEAMPVLEYLQLKRCKLSHVPRGLAFHTENLRELHVHDVHRLKCLDHFSHVVLLEAFRNNELERISFLPSLKNLVICKCPRMKVLKGVPALRSLLLEDYGMETLPRYLKDVNPWHLELHCTLSLLTSIAARKSSPEWDKLKHIQHVKANAESNGRKWYVMYTRDPFHFQTNISPATIRQGWLARAWFAYCQTCPIGDEMPVGQRAHADKRLPLCARFRCNSYRHVVGWLRGACLHCSEAMGVASSSELWMESVRYAAYISYQTTYGRLQ